MLPVSTALADRRCPRRAPWDTPALVVRRRLSRAPVLGTFVPRGAPAVPRPPVRLATTARQQAQVVMRPAPVQGRAVAPRGPTAPRGRSQRVATVSRAPLATPAQGMAHNQVRNP